jgi:hypothetical protein
MHVAEGQVYHFPILTNGTVSIHGSRIEPNPLAKRVVISSTRTTQRV